MPALKSQQKEKTAVFGVFDRYTEAQRVKHELVVSGYSSADIEVGSFKELSLEYDLEDDLLPEEIVLVLHSSKSIPLT